MTTKVSRIPDRGFVVALAICVLLLSPALCAQNITGTITGAVADATGAAVSGAQVVIINDATGVSTARTTNTTGAYEFPYLQPGTYTVTVSHTGFTTIVERRIELQLDKILRLSFTLQVGSVDTNVTVSSEGTAIDFESGSLGQAIPTKAVEDIPTLGRNIFDLVATSTEVQVNPYALGQIATDGGFQQSDISINGGRFRTNEFLLDGVSIMLPQNNNFALAPTPDATQEFKVMTNSVEPQFGRTGGGVVNVITKSGSNEFHGVAYDYVRNTILNANNYFANQVGQARAPVHFNTFGGTIGGRIRKDKTFFFGGYEAIRNPSATSGNFTTVPTAEQRRGNFSATFDASGKPVNIYDLYSTTLVGTTYTRTQFSGNVIPQGKLDPVALKMLDYLPLPNVPGVGPAQTRNYVYQSHLNTNTDSWFTRIDHRFSERHNIFGRIALRRGTIDNYGQFPSQADSSAHISNHAINFVLNDVLAISNTDMINLRYGFTRMFQSRAPANTETNLASLGFPAAVTAASQQSIFPFITITGFTTMGCNSCGMRLANDIHTFVTEQTLSRGRHTLVYGADVRLYKQNAYQGAQPSGTYTFGSNFTQGPNPATASTTSGNPFASFLLGYGSGSINTSPALAIQNWYWAIYFNDQAKLGRLTINAGVRYDHDQPLTERYNRFATFDFNAPFPISVPGLSGLHGVLTHPGQNGLSRGQYASYWKSVGPRVGLAYAITPKLALRAGYGISYSPRFGSTSGASFGASGYALSTTWVSSVDNYTPLNPLSNPYPTGLLQPLSTPADVLQIGQALNIADYRNISNTYIQQRNIGLQWEPGKGWFFEVAYSGSKGTHLPVPLNFNQLDPKYQSLGSALNTQVANPFYGLVTTGTLSTPTIARSQLLKPFPQYTSVSATNPPQQQNIGSSSYNSLSLKAQNRISREIYLLVGYTTGKLIADASGRIVNFGSPFPPLQNNFDLRSERAVDAGDVSRRLVISHTIDLPFGSGRRFLTHPSRVIDETIGGWSASGVFSYNTGWPLALSSTGNSGVGAGITRPNFVSGQNPKLSGTVESRLNRYLNTTAFVVPPSFTFGNVPRTLGNVRGPSFWNYNLALQKEFLLKDQVRLAFRLEAHNFTNTPYFLLPATQVGAAGFGQITASRNERQGQMALRLLF